MKRVAKQVISPVPASPARIEIPVVFSQPLGYRVLRPLEGDSLLDAALFRAVDALGAQPGDRLLVTVERMKGGA